jgi:uncharacterized protein
MNHPTKLVGMVQFPGFSHDPGGPARLRCALDRASEDAAVLLAAGFERLMLQNLGTRSPWRRETVEEVAAMASLLGRLKERFPEAAWGLNLPSDDPEASIAIAHAAGAAFVRLKVWVGVMRRAEGTLEGCANAALAYRHRLGADEVALWADVHDRTGTPVWPKSWTDGVLEARKAGATTIVVTGADPSSTRNMLHEARAVAPDLCLVVGGGATPETVGAFLQTADAIIVGTYLHRDGDERLPVDPMRARQMVAASAMTTSGPTNPPSTSRRE